VCVTRVPFDSELLVYLSESGIRDSDECAIRFECVCQRPRIDGPEPGPVLRSIHRIFEACIRSLALHVHA